MRMLVIAVLVLCSPVFAATKSYDVKVDLSVNGKRIAAPSVVVKDGETVTVFQKNELDETFIEVEAHEGMVQNRKGILMKFAVGTIDEFGERKIISRPQILAAENKLVEVTSGLTNNEKVSLSVVAKKHINK